MKAIVVFLLFIVLPAFLEAKPDAWWGRRHRQRQPPKQPATPDPQQCGSNYGPASCSASGDPHYMTFDKKRYDFMGECVYTLATDHCTVNGKPRLGTFKVIAHNRRCGRRGISCTRNVEVEIKGSRVHLKALNIQYKNTAHFTVKKCGNKLELRSIPAGLVVTWDGKMNAHVYLSKAYRSKVCGLCGNYDGNPNNDFIKSDGRRTNNPNHFGNSWGMKNCPGAPNPPKHPCVQKPHLKALAEKDCYVIKSCNFQACKDAGVDTDQLYHNCVYDVCADETDSELDSSCEAIKEASQQCKDKGTTVSWGHLADKCKAKPCTKKAKLLSSCQTKCCVFPFKTQDGVEHNDCVQSDIGSWCFTSKKANAKSIGICVPGGN